MLSRTPTEGYILLGVICTELTDQRKRDQEIYSFFHPKDPETTTPQQAMVGVQKLAKIAVFGYKNGLFPASGLNLSKAKLSIAVFDRRWKTKRRKP
jgi:hypothetical protein